MPAISMARSSVCWAPRKFGTTRQPLTPLPNKVAAHKYLAFSYCVTNRRTQCRKHFVDAIKLDANFKLEPTEKTHPVWGPEFERAKKQASAPTAPAKASRFVGGDAIR